MKTCEGAGRYINAFQAPFQGLPPLSHQDVYVLRACSLLVVPPPTGSVAPQGGFLTNLMGINLSDLAALVQDMVAGLQALPPGLSSCLGLQVVNLLQLLEAATGVGFFHFCCHPEPHCRFVGVSQSAPPMSWSQIAEQTPGYGVTASSGGVTTLSTSLGGMSDSWHLHQGSPFGTCLLWRPLYLRGQLYPHDTDLPLGGLHN